MIKKAALLLLLLCATIQAQTSRYFYGGMTSNGTGTFWFRTIIPAANQPATGDSVRVLFGSRTNGGSTIFDNASIGERVGSTEDYADVVQLSVSENTSWTISSGDSVWTDWVAYNFDGSADHLIHNAYNSETIGRIGGLLNGSYYKATATDESLTLDVTADGTSGNFYSVRAIETKTAAGEVSSRKVNFIF